MDTIDDFKQVIEGNYGISDLKSYSEYKFNVTKRGLTKEEIEKLSPDNVNSSSFWEYIEKNPEIAKDAIAFGIPKDGTREDVNKKNFSLACSLNALTPIIAYKDIANMPILDIGAGYGMLKEFVQQNTKLRYYGVDVYPKVDGVLKVGNDGSTLPNEIMEMGNIFGVVAAINVFQHLSIKQRRNYYKQIEQLLNPTCGVFVVTTCCEIPNAPYRGFVDKETNRQYMCHYGQYTEMQTYPEVMDDLIKHFRVLSISHRFDNSITFQCSSRPPEPPRNIPLDNIKTE